MAKQTYKFLGKAVSISQPWASAVAFAGKDVENRSWRTHYRGPLAIHASAKLWREDLDLLKRVVRGGEQRPLLDWINRGRRRYGLENEEAPVCSHLVAIAMLEDCVESYSSPWSSRGEGFRWIISGVIPIEPVAKKGKLGVWDCKFEYRPLIKSQ